MLCILCQYYVPGKEFTSPKGGPPKQLINLCAESSVTEIQREGRLMISIAYQSGGIEASGPQTILEHIQYSISIVLGSWPVLRG